MSESESSSRAARAQAQPVCITNRAQAEGRQRAQQYTRIGLRVIPVTNDDEKRPKVSGFDADAPAFTAYQRVKPNDMVAVLCGPCPALGAAQEDPTAGDWLFCLDRDGGLTRQGLAEALGVELPDTLSTHDGMHDWYRVEPGAHRDRLSQWNDVLNIRKTWQGEGKAPTADIKWCGGYARECKEPAEAFDVDQIAVLPVAVAEAIIARRPAADARESEPAGPIRLRLDADAVERMVAALVPAWPAEGEGRHDSFLALGGMLRRQGASLADTQAIAQAIIDGTGSDRSRVKDAADAWRRANAGQPAYGWTELASHLHGDADAILAMIDEATADPWIKMMIAKWPTLKRRKSMPALDALSPWVRKFVEAQQEELRTPLALTIGVALGAVAACVNGHVRLQLGPNWISETGLYVCCVAPSGQAKSPALKMATAPIKAWVAERQDAERDSREQRKLKREKLEADVKRLAKAWVEGYDEDPNAPEAAELRKKRIELEAMLDAVPLEYLIEDATPEVVVDLLATHGRLACITGEASKVFNLLGGKHDNKGQPDLSAWLEAYDGTLPKVHRIGRKAAEPRHEHTTLSALLMTQPVAMQRVANDPIMCGEGLVPRMTWVVCANDGPRWAPGEQSAPVPSAVLEAWGAGLRRMLDLPPGTVVRLSGAARAVELAWRDELEGRMQDDLGGSLAAWTSKHRERVGRIATGLWACDGATGLEISGEQYARAVTLGRWLIDHAKAVIVAGRAQAQCDALDAKVLASLDAGALTRRQIGRNWSARQLEGLDGSLTRLAESGRIVPDGDRWALA